jgi:hypothetical protein
LQDARDVFEARILDKQGSTTFEFLAANYGK